MNTQEIEILSGHCEQLKEMWSRLGTENEVSLFIKVHNSVGDTISVSLSKQTTKDITDDLKNILEAQVHVYEGKIKQLVASDKHKIDE